MGSPAVSRKRIQEKNFVYNVLGIMCFMRGSLLLPVGSPEVGLDVSLISLNSFTTVGNGRLVLFLLLEEKTKTSLSQ